MFQFPTMFFISQEPFWNGLKSYIGVSVKRCRRSSAEDAHSARMFWKSWPRRSERMLELLVAVESSKLWLQVYANRYEKLLEKRFVIWTARPLCRELPHG